MRAWQGRLDKAAAGCPVCYNLDASLIPERARRFDRVFVDPYQLRVRAGKGCAVCGLLMRVIYCYEAPHVNTDNTASDLSILFEKNGMLDNLRITYNPLTGTRCNLSLQLYVNLPRSIGCSGYFVRRRNTRPLQQLRSGTLSSLPRLSIALSPKANACIDLIKAWLGECESHEQCKLAERQLPTRLVDVGPLTDGGKPNPIRLVYSKTLPEQTKYCALSYCWGPPELSSRRDVLNSDNALSWEQELPTRAISASISDAVFVARSVGVRYLWVDSLCIKQEDTADWQIESGRMLQYYRSAYLTIAATSAPDAFTHWLRPRALHTIRADGNWPTIDLRVREHVFERGVVDIGFDADHNPLSKRGWCLQERLLSRRVVHFLAHETFFVCNTSSRYESRSMQPPSSNDKFDTTSATFQEAVERPSPRSTLRARKEQLAARWEDILYEYTRMRLTNADDMLPAISGIAKPFYDLEPDLGPYHAGLWTDEDVLRRSLHWWSIVPGSRPPQNVYVAPSFSWASRIGDASHRMHLPAPFDRETVTSLTQSLRIETTLQSQDSRFGRVTAGILKCRTSLWRIQIARHDVTLEYWYERKGSAMLGPPNTEDDLLNDIPIIPRRVLEGPGSGYDVRICFDTKDDKLASIGQELYYMPIEARLRYFGHYAVSMLVLRRYQDQHRSHSYERVGLIEEMFNSPSGTTDGQEPMVEEWKARRRRQDISIF